MENLFDLAEELATEDTETIDTCPFCLNARDKCIKHDTLPLEKSVIEFLERAK